MSNIRAVAYIRVSDLSQVEGHSLDAQERAIAEYCRAKGWTLTRVYREEGKSAHTDDISKRPVFQQLLQDAREGRFDVVVVHTLDRWSRKLQVTLDSIGQLATAKVGWISITEGLDWANPQSRLLGQMLGAFAEHFSEMLSVHVKKGIDERALAGHHLGAIPFGYESCWTEVKGEKQLRCPEEHPGGLHIHPTEGPAVQELFRRYAAGTTTRAPLATWLNDDGFRTRNAKKLPGADGDESAGPRLFTSWSVGGLLNNHFYTGKVRHKEKLLPGAHEALVSEELFQAVQDTLRKNSGRSRTLTPRPPREYLLKGMVKCAWCGGTLWAQTLTSGSRLYREQNGSRSHMDCPADGTSIRCDIPDEQIGRIVQAIVLPEAWQERLLAQVHLADEVQRTNKERAKVEEQLRRVRDVYMDGDLPKDEYTQRRRSLEEKLHGLVVPGVDAAKEAGKLLECLPQLWEEANASERHDILLTMLDAVFVDTLEEKAVVAIRPKPAFQALFALATTQEGSGVILNPPGQLRITHNGQQSVHGGDGGESNSPSKGTPNETATGLVGDCFSPSRPPPTKAHPTSQ